MGIQTLLSEGSGNISDGQRQRILIASAFATKPEILIFDKATSSLDNLTQSIVTESLNYLFLQRVFSHKIYLTQGL